MPTKPSDVVRCPNPSCHKAIIAVWSGTCYGAQCSMCQRMVCEGPCRGRGHEKPTATCPGRPVPKFNTERELRENKIEETRRYLDILKLMQEEINQVHSNLEPTMILLEDRLCWNKWICGNKVPESAKVTQAHWDVMPDHQKLEKLMTADEIRVDGPAIQLATNYQTYISKNRERLEEQLVAVTECRWQPTNEAWAQKSCEPGYMASETQGDFNQTRSTVCFHDSVFACLTDLLPGE